MTISASFFDNLYRKIINEKKNSLKKSVFLCIIYTKRWGDLNGYYNHKRSIDSELKQEVGEVLNEIGLDYTTAINLYFNKIRRDRKIPFELEARKNLTVDEFLGSNWREGLENVEDGWDWVIKLNWYLKHKMIFIN